MPPVGPSSSSGSDPRRPYGGLVPSQPRGARAYQDAATYNHQLAQHQAYTQAQAQATNTYRNPYITQPQQQPPQPPSSFPMAQENVNPGYSSQFTVAQPPAAATTAAGTAQRGLTHQTSAGQLGVNTSVQSSNHPSGIPAAGTHLNPNPPQTSYYSTTRGRANTINQMDGVPPALARLQLMNQDVIGGRNALTPVLNRDDAMREWERRQAGKPSAAQPYPQLEYLQQQAELAAAQGLTNWSHANNQARYPPPSKLSRTYHPPNIIVDDDGRRDAVMSNVRSAARADGPPSMYSSSTVISSPPQAYNSNATTSGNRYASTYAQGQPQQQAPSSPFDSIDRRTDIGSLYVPMQPDPYQTYNASSVSSSSSSRHVAPPAQAVAPSFYGASVVSTGQHGGGGAQRNPFSGAETSQQQQQGGQGQQQGQGQGQGQMSTKENRRGSGMELWPQR
jgi:dual specificity protein kinase YAK1